MLPHSVEVVHQLAATFEALGDLEQAVEWYTTLLSLVPTDPNVLGHLGDMFDRQDDKGQAFQYHFEAFRYFPSNMATISWFGSYYIESQYIEKAIQYFERAVEVQ